MKKYFVFILFSLLVLSSCSKKVSEENISTPEQITETNNSIVEEDKESEKNIVSDSEETETIVDSEEKTFRDTEKKYEITYKNNPDFIVNEKEGGIDFFIGLETGESFNITTEDFSSSSISTTKEYLDLSIENLKSILQTNDLKIEEVILNWLEGYKIIYFLGMEDVKLSIEQHIFTTDEKLAIILTRTWLGELKEFEDVVNSFKLLK